jgi:hypothetical protein
MVGPTCQVTCVMVGPTVVRWTNEVLTRGTDMLRWSNEVLTRGTLSLFSDSVCVCLRSPIRTQQYIIPKLHPDKSLIES